MSNKVKDVIFVKIIVGAKNIYAVHRTVSGILSQVGRERFQIAVQFDNVQKVDLSQEIQRLNERQVQVVESKLRDAQYSIILEAGSVLSPAFFYKGTTFFKNNPKTSIVCPEYELMVSNGQLLVANTFNKLYNDSFGALKKSGAIDTRSTSISDTCLLMDRADINIKNLPKDCFLKKLDSFKPTSIKPAQQDDKSQHKTIKSIVKGSLKKTSAACDRFVLTRKAKTFTKIVLGKMLEKRNSYHWNYSNILKSELSCVEKIAYEISGYEQYEHKNITEQKYGYLENIWKEYQAACVDMQHNRYDYLIVLPWLIHGGVDLFAVNYLNFIAELYPEKNILAITTCGVTESLSKEELGLDERVDLISIANITKSDQWDDKFKAADVLYSIINNVQPSVIHIMMSEVGYKCLEKYEEKIRTNGTKSIFTSYNSIVDTNQHQTGYTVRELPKLYRKGDIVTTDSVVVKDRWVQEFGLCPDDIKIHKQYFSEVADIQHQPDKQIRILWAAHIRKEKNPEVLPKIAEKLKSENINVEIDCYGELDKYHWAKNPLSDYEKYNLYYKGPYCDFFKDIDLASYDLFLYTSKFDGMPNVVIEAGLASLPIVSTRVGGAPDFLGDNGELVEDSDSVEEFCEKIKTVIKNYSDSQDKADKLKKNIQKEYGQENFKQQVREMLGKDF